MLEPIYIAATKLTPSVKLNAEDGLFEISGRSLPEDVLTFYSDIRKWIKKYCENPNPKTIVNFNLEYFNSSSARILVKILIDFEAILLTDNKIKVFWNYKKNDEVIKNRGYEIKSVVLLPFEVRELD